MAAEDDEGDETMCDEVDAPGGAMGDGDDGGDGNGGDDRDDDDNDDKDDGDDDPEFDWTGLEKNISYVSGVRSACRSFYADHPCVLFAPSVFYVTCNRSLVSVRKPFGVRCKTCHISKKKCTLVQRKAKTSGVRSSDSV